MWEEMLFKKKKKKEDSNRSPRGRVGNLDPFFVSGGLIVKPV